MVTKICTPPQVATQKMFFANASKMIRNWFLTFEPDLFKIICNLPKWAQEKIWT